MTQTGKDIPGVIARPPLIYLSALALGFGLDYMWLASVLPNPVQYVVGAGLIALGVIILATAMRQFRRTGTNMQTWKPTTALVTGGLYRLSRNPIYVALNLIYAGIGIAADNLWALGLLVPLLVIIRYGVVAREERYLERKFGQDYLSYKASVRRWL